MVTREQHLNSLTEVPGLQTVVKHSRWKVQLQPPSRHICTIWIDLPNGFPHEAPVITLYPNIDHHWVQLVNGSARIVGHSHVRPWCNNYLLGQLIIDVIQEISGVRFQATPQQIPKTLSTQSSGLTRGNVRAQDAHHQQQKQQDASAAATAKMTRGGTRGVEPSVSAGPQMPVIPTNFPDLEKLSAEELEELQEDPDALQEFVEKLEMASSYRSMQEELETNNEALARKTLTKKEKVLYFFCFLYFKSRTHLYRPLAFPVGGGKNVWEGMFVAPSANSKAFQVRHSYSRWQKKNS
jgi:hypothetical protein